MPGSNRRRFLLVSGAAGLGGLGLAKLLFSGGTGNRPVSFTEPGSGKKELQGAKRTSHAFGAEVSMLVLHEELLVAQKALDAAFDELDTVEKLMSLYRPESQLCRLNRDGVLDDPHPYLLTVLRASQDLAARSAGAFDVTVQPLWEIYWAAYKRGRLPSDKELLAARSKVDWRKIELTDRRVKLTGAGMSVTLNGIAQGYAADRVMVVLREQGIAHALVNAGEVVALGGKENNKPWLVGIQHPRQKDAFVAVAELAGRCLATSGDYETSFTPDYVYNHIFDPATGASPLHFSSVSVVAPLGIDVDGLSTAVFVAGMERGLRLIEATPGAEALLVRKDGSMLATKGFPKTT